MRCDSFVASGESNRHSSTLVACSANRAKLTPAPSQVAPSGYERPGQMRMGVSSRVQRPRGSTPRPGRVMGGTGRGVDPRGLLASAVVLEGEAVELVLRELGGDAAAR